jgi:hypothetical protein
LGGSQFPYKPKTKIKHKHCVEAFGLFETLVKGAQLPPPNHNDIFPMRSFFTKNDLVLFKDKILCYIPCDQHVILTQSLGSKTRIGLLLKDNQPINNHPLNITHYKSVTSSKGPRHPSQAERSDARRGILFTSKTRQKIPAFGPLGPRRDDAYGIKRFYKEGLSFSDFNVGEKR